MQRFCGAKRLIEEGNLLQVDGQDKNGHVEEEECVVVRQNDLMTALFTHDSCSVAVKRWWWSTKMKWLRLWLWLWLWLWL